ncbi:MAG: TspO/MBR family protein [Candidatus Uhrbacteria bacterium]|nr:tryptophan-rich sensory protein [Patescibacteria group bacterium]MBU1906610.1 tryptophan-rich sensory protein [Patescibacteria group bacterium]
MKKFLQLVAAVAIAHAAGVIGSFFTVTSVGTWYADLVRPEFAPPNWLFGPVWLTLFTLMGIAAWLIWINKEKKLRECRKVALIFFGVQLGMNSIWSILFFGMQNPAAALFEIVMLWIMILATIIVFWKINKAASILLWPYLVWVSFAAYLNLMFVILN